MDLPRRLHWIRNQPWRARARHREFNTHSQSERPSASPGQCQEFRPTASADRKCIWAALTTVISCCESFRVHVSVQLLS
ncbi:hypothetical protein MHYP_G00338650 [Metynnis hypsauchen]